MKKIIDAIRDFLYNITDYGLIITVIVIMALILGWRFNILFNREIDKKIIAELPVIAEPIEENGEKDPELDIDEKPPIEEGPSSPNENPEPNGVIATIVIPEGSFPSSIGDILINSNLIDNKQNFLNRSMELGLDTRLRSGKFQIQVGTSLDDIIKIIANAQ